jgi:predicted nucleic acid-binding protein
VVQSESGLARIFTLIVAYLVDTNVLVYRYDARFPDKQARATKLLRAGIASGDARLSHQVLVEFVAASTRKLPKRPPLLKPEEAWREAEELLAQVPVLYPVEALFRLAIRGAATYQLSWFDAHMWAYAEHYSLPLLYSEDFQHDRVYGTVRVVNPFAD